MLSWWCYHDVTWWCYMVLPWCYHDVTWCYHDVTWCYHDDVTMMLPWWCYHDVAMMMLPWCYHDVTLMLPDVTMMLPWCYMVLWWWCYHDVTWCYHDVNIIMLTFDVTTFCNISYIYQNVTSVTFTKHGNQLHTKHGAVHTTSLTDSKDKSHAYLKDRLTHHTLQWWIAT